MTPTQSTQLSRVAAKHGESGWTIELTQVREKERNWSQTINPQWNCSLYLYRAVGPRKRVELKRGMEVRTAEGDFLAIASACPDLVILADMFGVHKKPCNVATHYRCACGESPWLPIEGEPEIISMEGVE